MGVTICIIIILLSGGYLMWASMVMDTPNLISTVIFKFIPLILGMGCLFSGVKLFGWI